MDSKPNIIVITIDSLRADHLGFLGYEKNVSPNIDAFSKESAVFNKAFSVGPGTAYSFPAILTSTYPLDFHGPREIERPRVMVSEAFKQAGYTTAFIHSSPYLSDYFGYNKGWDYFEDMYPGSRSGAIQKSFLKNVFKEITLSSFPEILFRTMYLRYKKGGRKNSEIKTPGHIISQTAKDLVSSVKDKPFFIWIHYMDLHVPYIPQEKYNSGEKLSFEQVISDYIGIVFYSYSEKKALKRFINNKFKKKYLDRAISFYDDQIAFTDRLFGEFTDFLKRENLYSNSVICLAGDHGDEFLDHGGLTHTGTLYNELLHVPLLIKAPGKAIGQIKEKVSLIDLSPTLCSLAGLQPPDVFKGSSLFENRKGIVFHQGGQLKKGGETNDKAEKIKRCRTACQTENYKYIFNHSGKQELYNLLKDSQEQNNVAGEETEICSQMKNRVEEFLRKNPPFSAL